MGRDRIAPVPAAATPLPSTEPTLKGFADDLTLELRELASLVAIIREREEAMATRDDTIEGALANVESQLRTIANRVDACAYDGRTFVYHGSRQAVAA